MFRSLAGSRCLAGAVSAALLAGVALFVGPVATAGEAGCPPAANFAGGTGTKEDPYQIATAGQLSILSADDSYWGDHFVLTADIDLESCPWQPVGSEDTAFTGSFDGSGFAVLNLFIDRAFFDDVGFFGVIFAPGEVAVDNLHLVDVDVRGKTEVGAIAGTNGSIIQRSSASGKVTGGEEVNVNGLIGGLVGENGRRVEDVRHPGLIAYSLSLVDVTSVGGRFVGGLVGYNRQNSSIVDSYARGSVNATSSDPTFNPVDATAGFAGYNGVNATIDRAYATGETTSNGPELGGFLGRNDDGGSPAGVVERSFWDTETTGQAASAGGSGESTAAMTSIGLFEAASWPIVAGWAPFVPATTVWGICPEVNDGYPYLLWEYEVSPCAAPEPGPEPAPEPAPAAPRFTG